MNIKALITSIVVLASSSAAMAAPGFQASASVDADASWRTGWTRDHRHDVAPAPQDARNPYRAPEPTRIAPIAVPADPTNVRIGPKASTYSGPIGQARRGWSGMVALTEPTRIEAGSEYFAIGPQAGRFDTLRLVGVRGASHIIKVAVQFQNGKTQLVTFDRTLDARSPSLSIDLEGTRRQILRVIVYGTSGPHATYQILAT